ncbi:MAG TPA: hypothetical protein VED87_02005 [Methylocystis sp.]|nr:hypothetical protein [Methylocystis sp.]
MSDEPERRRSELCAPRAEPAQGEQDEKAAARAAALRENLRRRKAAAKKDAPAPRDRGTWTK